MPDIKIANSNQAAKLIGNASRTQQGIWNEIVGIITNLEEHLATKYGMDIEDIELGKIYLDPKKGKLLVFGAFRLTDDNPDFKLFDVLKKARQLYGNIFKLSEWIKHLPARTVDCCNTASAARAQAHFLLRASQNQLAQYVGRKQAEDSLLRIVTDLGTLQQQLQSLLEFAYTKQAVAA